MTKFNFFQKTATAAIAAGMLFNIVSAQAAELTPKQQGIIPIAALTARGDANRLKTALAEQLDNKRLTVNEIKDVLVQMYAYTGFPRSLTGLNAFVQLLDERKKAGIEDYVGRAATPLAPNTDIRALGTKTQTELVGRPVSGPVYDFSPEIDTYLKEHLFGDIFSSDLLTHQEREIATISALASLPAPVQLRSHLNASLNTGLTPNALTEFTEILSREVDDNAGTLARSTLQKVLETRSAGSAR